ncbi:MAG: ring-cleaving dioxygenase [Thermomicrobiales bacterium]|nr:ring-cleaving dioxygenase [Thermomicrobiales bacterium]
MELGGLHHVTAVTANAPLNLDFYTNLLGLRLVKKTVNQDDVSAYHLFYGDEVGNPGTELTFFDWDRIGPNRPGTGGIVQTGLRVTDEAALDWWMRRLDAAGIAHGGIEQIAGYPTVRFADPEGQQLALVAGGENPGFTPWRQSPVPAEHQIRGLNHVLLAVDRLGPTARTLTDVLGFRHVGNDPSPDNSSLAIAIFESGPGGPGTQVRVEERPNMPPTELGSGGVHHVAFRAPNDSEHRAWRDRVRAAGLGITDVIDRYYFKSLYFREPGRILFEIATDGPGFATDEDVAHLGERLALPPFLEPHRAAIEAGLRPLRSPVTTPGA